MAIKHKEIIGFVLWLVVLIIQAIFIITCFGYVLSQHGWMWFIIGYLLFSLVFCGGFLFRYYLELKLICRYKKELSFLLGEMGKKMGTVEAISCCFNVLREVFGGKVTVEKVTTGRGE